MKNLGREPEIVRLMCRTLAGAITVLAPLKFRERAVRLGGHNRKSRFISARHTALIPKKLNQVPPVFKHQRDATIGQRPNDCESVKILSHVNSLAEESRAKNDNVFMLRGRKPQIRSFPERQSHRAKIPMHALRKTFSESQPLDGLRVDHEKVVQIVKLLVEGVGIRACSRLADCHIHTVLSVLEIRHLTSALFPPPHPLTRIRRYSALNLQIRS